ncbi:MAG: metalloregulator ArsR/SmtB family transcription factor [Bacteroidota bacterium]
MMRRDVFRAIADPTRRAILNIISHQPLTVNTVAGNFSVSRTAIYKHIKILKESGLVIVKKSGRERYCEAKMGKLQEVTDWVTQFRERWDQRLVGLEQCLDEWQVAKRESSARKKSSRGGRNTGGDRLRH